MVRDGGIVPDGEWKSSKPQNSYKSLHLFYILRDWIGLYLTNHSFWDNVHLIQQNNSPKLYHVAWALNFLWARHPSSPLPMLAKSAECPAAQASLYIQHNIINVRGLFYWCAKENRGRSQATIHDIWWGCAGSLGEPLERTTIVPLTWRQIDRSIGCFVTYFLASVCLCFLQYFSCIWFLIS